MTGDVADVHLVDDFCAATMDELVAAGSRRRLMALADQRLRFPHRGRLRLSRGALELGDWRRFVPADIGRARRGYVASYGRLAAAGVRGAFPSLAAVRDAGAPLILDLRSGESIALLVGFRPISGLNRNRATLTALRRFVASSH